MKISRQKLKEIINEELETFRMNGKVTLNEDGHEDVPSAVRKLKTAVEDAAQILQSLESQGDVELPSWWMSKITIASDYLNKARDYALFDSLPTNLNEALSDDHIFNQLKGKYLPDEYDDLKKRIAGLDKSFKGDMGAVKKGLGIRQSSR